MLVLSEIHPALSGLRLEEWSCGREESFRLHIGCGWTDECESVYWLDTIRFILGAFPQKVSIIYSPCSPCCSAYVAFFEDL